MRKTANNIMNVGYKKLNRKIGNAKILNIKLFNTKNNALKKIKGE